MPFFSVVVPLYNKENFIEATLKSILDQTFIDFEVLIIDDASTDCSLKIVRKWASAKIKIIEHQQNRGLSAARNTGIKMATAKYIAFLDADDCWHPNYLETLVSLINQYPEAQLFATNYLEIYSKNIGLAPKTAIQNTANHFIITDFFKSSLQQPIYCPSSLCVTKTVFNQVGLYDETITFGEDVDFNIRANTAYKLAYASEPKVYYNVSSQNQITKLPLKNKTIPNFDSYEALAKVNPALKKYLDFHRYIFAKMYKIENDMVHFKALKKGIHRNPRTSGLNKLQLLLLNSPPVLLRLIGKIKKYLVRKGYRFTSY